ncbi:hypothetical protein E1B28_005006 [Marasmius oreades]|uniref:F-box domain-containing protein n=1 Tax=Marasmius oreades TaxID=181124 RepID=A0A9P8ADU5_9AGAR|nr:uncharacterized protein E1B28_005006 [Marasmius oreades]KAG7097680.1 hypothetical protein E1B28_005006 [Marasmius oreades]
MDCFPPELVAHICSLACTDNGATVKSLALASKYLAQVCSPMHYQSLSIISHEDVARLGVKLSVHPEHLRRIFHIHFSLPFPDHGRLHKDIEDVIHLLLLAASSIETLTFTSPNVMATPTVISRMFRIPMPRLSELSIHGFYPLPNPKTIHMPLLERLHLSGNRNPHGFLRTVKDSFPHITHLRLSGLSMAVSFARELESHLKIYHSGGSCVSLRAAQDENTSPVLPSENYWPDSLLVPSHLPARLQYLVIQPETRQGCMVTTNNAKRDASMMETLLTCVDAHARWLKQVGKSASFNITLREGVHGSENEEKSPCFLLYEDWLNRLMGGPGCWEM